MKVILSNWVCDLFALMLPKPFVTFNMHLVKFSRKIFKENSLSCLRKEINKVEIPFANYVYPKRRVYR